MQSDQDRAVSGRIVLVTGGLGFLGLNVLGPLLDAGAEVRVLSRSLRPLALRWLPLATAGRTVEVITGDIGDTACLQRALDGVDAVVDLAAESGAAKSLREAQADIQVNVADHLRLLDSIRSRPQPPHVVFASSRLVYGVTGGLPVTEEHPTRPTSLYGLHKLTVEHYLRIYREQFGLSYTVLRLTNPYGPFQIPERRHYGVLNRFVMAAIRGEAIALYGDGAQQRDYVHAADVASAFILACARPQAAGETFNVGGGRSVTLAQAAKMIVASSGSGSITRALWPDADRRVETGDFRCDVSRIRAALGWSPSRALEDGLPETVEAYRALLVPEYTHLEHGTS